MSLPGTYINAGDSAEWSITDSRLSSGWTAEMYLVDGIAAPVTLAGSVSSDTATFTLTPAASAALPVSSLRWAVVVKNGTDDRVTIASGTVIVRANPGAAGTASFARTNLGLIETAINDLLTNKGITSVQYLGVSYTRDNLQSLYQIRSKLLQEVLAEERQASGKPSTPLKFRKVSLTR